MDYSEHSKTKPSEMHTIIRITHTLATIWIAREQREEASYFYGGTRLVDPATTDQMATNALLRLMNDESGTKNHLINWAIEDGILDKFRADLPDGFLKSCVGGARCLIRPRTRGIASSLSAAPDPQNGHDTAAILECIGNTLNEQEPRIKLTPDFGRYAGLADILFRYTPNTLGIRCEEGGCGGKSSYSTTGVVAGVDQAASALASHSPVTFIGSAGAMGTGLLQYLLTRGIKDLAACDLVYDAPGGPRVPDGCKHLQSRLGMFTSECLARGGMIVATTIGDELNASPWQLIPRGSVLLLAHNLALPEGERGIQLARSLAENGVLVIPGQVLTLGGALTARLEWYWRQQPSSRAFDKSLAHRVVYHLVSQLIVIMLGIAEQASITPYEAMLSLAGEDR